MRHDLDLVSPTFIFIEGEDEFWSSVGLRKWHN